MSRCRFTLNVTIVVDVEHAQLLRMSAPDRERYAHRKVQTALDLDDVRTALDRADVVLVDATAMTCREGRD